MSVDCDEMGFVMWVVQQYCTALQTVGGGCGDGDTRGGIELPKSQAEARLLLWIH
jgi:hypothetical protein